MNFVHLMLMMGMAALAGCCCASESLISSGSSSCTLGTYGEACTDLCSRTGEGEGCVSRCIDEVRTEGMGDATTCCTSTYRDQCQETCNEYGSYGVEECMSDCEGQYAQFGFSMDECGLPV